MDDRFEWEEIRTECREARLSAEGEELRCLVNRERIHDAATGLVVTRLIIRHPMRSTWCSWAKCEGMARPGAAGPADSDRSPGGTRTAWRPVSGGLMRPTLAGPGNFYLTPGGAA